MDILGIASKLIPYAALALLVAGLLLASTILAYRLYRRRGGKRRISRMQFVSAFGLAVWLGTVLGLTMMDRGGHFVGWVNFRLFSGYVNAWNTWSLSEMQLILFNMLMFLPLGFLLPLLGKRLRGILPVLCVSIAVTIAIEAMQMLTGKGIFELDDILHNVIGSMSGYFLISAIIGCVEFKKLRPWLLLRAAAIPLAFLLLFSGALVVYNGKEMGNMPIRPAIPQPMEGVEIQLTADLSRVPEPVAVYRNSQIHNMEYGEKMLSLIKEHFRLTQTEGLRIDGYNRTCTLLAPSGDIYHYNFSLSDGTWSLGNEENAEESLTPEEVHSQRDSYEQWLVAEGIIPENASFQVQNGETLRWEMLPPEDISQGDTDFFQGAVMIQASADLSLPRDIFCFLSRNSYVRHVDIITPDDAFSQLEQGNFQQYNDMKPGDKLAVTDWEITYVYDTKGYYRPAYLFRGTLNGEEWSCTIAAMEG